MSVEFKDFRAKNTITLPVSGATVEVWDGLLTRDLDQLQGNKVDLTKAMSFLIASWDFEMEGNPVEVTPENVGKLHMKDFYAIQKAANLTDFLGEDGASPTGS